MFFHRTETVTSGADEAIQARGDDSFESLSGSTARSSADPIDAETLILGDLEQAELATRVAELEEAFDQISTKVEAQFVTIASHAEIAKRDNEFARGEASASSNRIRDELISLIEQVRAVAIGAEATTAETANEPAAGAALERTLALINRRIDDIATRQLSLEQRLSRLERPAP